MLAITTFDDTYFTLAGRIRMHATVLIYVIIYIYMCVCVSVRVRVCVCKSV